MALNIIDYELIWNGEPGKRDDTAYIVLHHAAAEGAALTDIHNWHLTIGWAGIGYHFYIRRDGSVHRGRPEDSIGAHALGYNHKSIGICFEGNFETEELTELQLLAGSELLSYLCLKYDISSILRHSDINETACPGANFRIKRITGSLNTDMEDDAARYAKPDNNCSEMLFNC